MSAANSLFPYGLCDAPCYGRLSPADSENLCCEQCGDTRPLHDPADLTEAEADLFNIPQIKCTAAELEPMRWHQNREDFDHLDTFEDIQPFTRTTRY